MREYAFRFQAKDIEKKSEWLSPLRFSCPGMMVIGKDGEEEQNADALTLWPVERCVYYLLDEELVYDCLLCQDEIAEQTVLFEIKLDHNGTEKIKYAAFFTKDRALRERLAGQCASVYFEDAKFFCRVRGDPGVRISGKADGNLRAGVFQTQKKY